MRSPVYTPNDPVKSVKQLHSWLYQLNENLKFMFSNLDSDNFTSEFSSNFSQEAAQKTQVSLQNLEESLNAISAKSAWEKIELSGLTAVSDDTAPALLNWNGLVYITGTAVFTADLPDGGTLSMGELPSKHIPRRTQKFICQAGGHLLSVSIGENGEITLSNSSGETILQNTIVSFSFSYAL